MKSLILFLKGFIIGIGKIIPGVSGSVLAISLGVYENSLQKLNHFFKNIKENILYFLPLGIGISLAVLLGSNIILYALDHFYLYTMVLFIGLIVGTIPNMIKKQSLKGKDWLIIWFIFSFLYLFYQSLSLPEFIPSNSLLSHLYIIFLGMLDAFTTIIPGISGTATYMVLGSYHFVMNLFSQPFLYPFFVFLFGLGLLIGLILIIKFINFCFQHYAHLTGVVIIAFLFSSVYFLILKVIDSINSSNILSLSCLFIFSYLLITIFDKE